jgi:hypothetical protein
MSGTNTSSNKGTKKARPLYPAGETLAEVSWAEFGLSKTSSNEMITFTLTCKVGTGMGRKVYYRTTLNDEAVWKHDRFAVAALVNPSESKAARTNPSQLLQLWVGKTVKLITKHEEYVTNGVKRMGADIVAIDSLDPKVREFQAKEREARMSGGQLVEGVPTAHPITHDVGDDIPF